MQVVKVVEVWGEMDGSWGEYNIFSMFDKGSGG
jgi:hypothetical protein